MTKLVVAFTFFLSLSACAKNGGSSPHHNSEKKLSIAPQEYVGMWLDESARTTYETTNSANPQLACAAIIQFEGQHRLKVALRTMIRILPDGRTSLCYLEQGTQSVHCLQSPARVNVRTGELRGGPKYSCHGKVELLNHDEAAFLGSCNGRKMNFKTFRVPADGYARYVGTAVHCYQKALRDGPPGFSI